MAGAAWPDGFAVTEDARAKINLALHVTGQRADGYHLLEMLVTFARTGDRLGFAPADADAFTLSGPFAAGLGDDAAGNLVIKARDRLRDALASISQPAPPVHIHLEKNLPIASGIGGGSADAAAALRGLLRVWKAEISDGVLADLALRLGADVPMCLRSRPLIARGIGEDITMADKMPAFAMVLCNPLVAVSTPEVFRRLPRKDNAALDTSALAGSDKEWMAGIRDLRNDLQVPAGQLCPKIGVLLTMLEGEGAAVTRMSGSGASCFGLFTDMKVARAAAGRLGKARPDWYFQAVETVAGGALR